MAVKIDKLTYLQIGQRDENLARDIELDATDWVELFPDASIHILFRRPGEDTVTPVLTELTEDGMLIWHVAQFEVGVIGVGHAEIRAVNQEGLRRKSVVVPCSIEETITGEDGAVLYTQDEVNQTLANIGDATRAASEAAVDAAAAEGHRDSARTYAEAAEASKDAAAQSAVDAAAQVTLAVGHAARAETAQTAAAESAAAAKTSETNAKNSELVASVNQMSALQYSKNAKQSADKAESQASMAETAKGLAFDEAERASASASAVAQSATNAAASASAASTSESNAAASASAASTSESNAAASASSAAQSASQASGSATQAGNSAAAAAGSATQAGQSATAAGQSARNAEDAAQDAQDVLDSIPADYSQMSADVADLKDAVLDTAPAIIAEASGALASFSDGADGAPMKSLVAHIEPVQEGSGDPSPDNIRPITGWTGVKAHRTNKNLLIGEDVLPYMKKYIPSGDIKVDGGGKRFIWFSAAAGVKNEYDGLFPYIHFKENTQYTFIFTYSKTSGIESNMRIYYTDRTYKDIATLPDNTESYTKMTIVTVSDPNKTVQKVAKAHQSGATRLYFEESGIFEGVLTEDDFVPYEGNTYEVTFPSEAGTVYGGTLDVASGVLKVDWEKRVLDGTEDWRGERLNYPNNAFYILFIGDLGYVVDGTIISDKYIKATINTSSTEIGVSCFNSTARNHAAIYLRPNHDGMSVADFKTWLSGNPVTCVYKLATPIIYQLTPQEVKTLLGQNYVFADTGDVDVAYQADTKLYIDNKVNELQALVLENIGG